MGDLGKAFAKSFCTVGMVNNLPLYLILIILVFQLIIGFVLSKKGMPSIVFTVASSTSNLYYRNNSPIFNEAVVNAVVFIFLPSASLTLIYSHLLSLSPNFKQLSRDIKLLVAPLSTRHLHYCLPNKISISISYFIVLIVDFYSFF